ncbi:flavodoxin family protein [Nocardioides jishulii]|uniref:Flavodoxin family protein n=1 Tax=Nocardioides jishulii TaxID=2575440 RepID=A0A4U2YIB8_9ACTN|nr:NAD(P)H-dependent oxidoreductase [Nocardioides jishulii]QCX27967.1 flavodoxin family protein [Nocardioides jishulii]TKI60630.1 flavodoxin family protein [Nocardioides jishulii]
MESSPPRLLVVHHSPTPGARALTGAVLAGTRDPELAELGDLEVVVREALEARADDVRSADGLLLGTPANFGYMSGALKHFFDSTFLHLGGALSDDGRGAEAHGSGSTLPYALWVHGRYDTVGATRSVESIVQALPWRRVLPPLELLGEVDDAALGAAHELGATVAALTLESR